MSCAEIFLQNMTMSELLLKELRRDRCCLFGTLSPPDTIYVLTFSVSITGNKKTTTVCQTDSLRACEMWTASSLLIYDHGSAFFTIVHNWRQIEPEPPFARGLLP